MGLTSAPTHATTACNMPVLDAGAGGLFLGALVQRLAAATTPLLIRGLLDLPGWRAQAGFSEVHLTRGGVCDTRGGGGARGAPAIAKRYVLWP